MRAGIEQESRCVHYARRLEVRVSNRGVGACTMRVVWKYGCRTGEKVRAQSASFRSTVEQDSAIVSRIRCEYGTSRTQNVCAISIRSTGVDQEHYARRLGVRVYGCTRYESLSTRGTRAASIEYAALGDGRKNESTRRATTSGRAKSSSSRACGTACCRARTCR